MVDWSTQIYWNLACASMIEAFLSVGAKCVFPSPIPTHVFFQVQTGEPCYLEIDRSNVDREYILMSKSNYTRTRLGAWPLKNSLLLVYQEVPALGKTHADLAAWWNQNGPHDTGSGYGNRLREKNLLKTARVVTFEYGTLYEWIRVRPLLHNSL